MLNQHLSVRDGRQPFKSSSTSLCAEPVTLYMKWFGLRIITVRIHWCHCCYLADVTFALDNTMNLVLQRLMCNLIAGCSCGFGNPLEHQKPGLLKSAQVFQGFLPDLLHITEHGLMFVWKKIILNNSLHPFLVRDLAKYQGNLHIKLCLEVWEELLSMFSF